MDRAVDEGTRMQLAAIRGWRGLDNPWMREDEAEDDVEYSYINLLANPERYTGYKVTVARGQSLLFPSESDTKCGS